MGRARKGRARQGKARQGKAREHRPMEIEKEEGKRKRARRKFSHMDQEREGTYGPFDASHLSSRIQNLPLFE